MVYLCVKLSCHDYCVNEGLIFSDSLSVIDA